MSELALYLWAAFAVTSVGGATVYYRLHRTRYLPPLRDERARKNAPTPKKQQGVHDPNEAAEMFRNIQRDMARVFGFMTSRFISAHLLSPPEIHRKMELPHVQEPPLGVCCAERGKLRIYVQCGLPKARLYATLAHEYAHVWQRLHGFTPRELERCEGFAEWVALVLTEMAGLDVSELLDRPPWDPCGSGMRRFAALEEIYGLRKAARLAKRRGFNFKLLRGDYKPLRGSRPQQ